MVTQQFPAGDVLSVTIGCNVSNNNEGILNVLNFMTGDKLLPHQCLFAKTRDDCRRHLLEQHPKLAEMADSFAALHRRLDATDAMETHDVIGPWLAEQIEKLGLGETLAVSPIPAYLY